MSIKENPPKIIVVEDNPACQDLYRTILADQNVNLFLVSRGSAALKLLENGLNCSVLITDYELPDMDGDQLIGRSCVFSPLSTKIVVSSINKNELDLDPEALWRIFHFLNKPINVRKFVEVVLAGMERYQENLMTLLPSPTRAQ